jgi:peptidoglycan L-alanyl-D-glutamate endopeptidase CwlK
MIYKLSNASLARLDGLTPPLIEVVKRAIEYTNVDFGVTCGMRTVAEQQELFDKGASQTMQSKHLEGLAVDVVAYVGSRISWEHNLYDDIADAFKMAAQEVGIGIKWGAAWHIPDVRDWDSTMEDAMNAYVDLRRSQGKRPFIDAPHFEIA